MSFNPFSMFRRSRRNSRVNMNPSTSRSIVRTPIHSDGTRKSKPPLRKINQSLKYVKNNTKSYRRHLRNHDERVEKRSSANQRKLIKNLLTNHPGERKIRRNIQEKEISQYVKRRTMDIRNKRKQRRMGTKPSEKTLYKTSPRARNNFKRSLDNY